MGRIASQQDVLPREALERLVAAYQPERIYLFGSHARGEAGPDSDIDLMIVVPDDATGDRRRGGMGYQQMFRMRLGKPIEFHVWRRFVFQGQTEDPLSLPSTVLKEGQLLYGSGHE